MTAEALKLKLGAKKVRVAGRLMLLRDMGKIVFAHLQDGAGRMQIVFNEHEIGRDKMKFFIKNFDLGDFIGVEGDIFKTKAGEKSVLVRKFEILAKALRPLPDKWHGITDGEERLRRRYLDIIMSPEVREMIEKRSVFWNVIREFLLKKDFVEVETPVLETITGGADARPFSTHHNALDLDVYLRISMGELWQKRLMIGGLEKTFEIGRQFRNEGMDAEHLQDYTQMEFYWAYANYEDSMALVEEMYKYVAKETFGKLEFDINGHKIDMDGKWKKIDYTETIKKEMGIDISKATNEDLKKKLNELKIKHEKNVGRGRLIDLLWKVVRKTVSGPVFLVGHPVEVSPLAKRKEDNPNFVEQYQVILAGSEMGKGYSELNDPIDQANRFEEQQKLRDEGDVEAQMNDWDFVRALEYGMPPVSGFGVSERLFSFLADKPIKETVLFPLLRPEDKAEGVKHDNKDKKVVKKNS